MAGDWIKMRTNLSDDPAVIQMSIILDCDEFAIIGRLQKFWSWCDSHMQDGNASGVTRNWLDRYISMPGFAAAMEKVLWLEINEAGLSIPHFERHNGKPAKTRALGKDRQKTLREGSDESNASSVTEALPEKRREEKSKEPSNPNGLDVASPAADLPAKSAKPDCPHQEIIALYHEVLPMCPQIRDWTPARATQLRARWNEDARRQNLEYWRQFFEYVAKCDFLVGKAHSNSRKPFFADLEWIVKSANFTKIREGKYAND